LAKALLIAFSIESIGRPRPETSSCASLTAAARAINDTGQSYRQGGRTGPGACPRHYARSSEKRKSRNLSSGTAGIQTLCRGAGTRRRENGAFA
jgi:hypothetical protein